MTPRIRLLITAGPTHEPIDAVRFLGNRSSGRLGVNLATAAADRGWSVTLLLGPATVPCTDRRVQLLRFNTVADLEKLLADHFHECDVLVMAAAVADFRPVSGSTTNDLKIRRAAGRLTLELEPTPDLLAACSARKAAGQTLIGFALEHPDHMLASARDKIARKNVDAIVANPLGTMDASDISAVFVTRDGTTAHTPGTISKADFAPWLLDHITSLHNRARATSG